MFSDNYMQLLYNHCVHKNVTLEQIFNNDTETEYPEFVPDSFIHLIVLNNNIIEKSIDNILIHERCIPNTDTILRQLYGFWKRKCPDTNNSLHRMIINYAYDYTFNKYNIEYYINKFKLVYEVDNIPRYEYIIDTPFQDYYAINDCPLARRLRSFIQEHNSNQPSFIDYDAFTLHKYYNNVYKKYGLLSEIYPLKELLLPHDCNNYPDRVPDEFLHLFVSFEIKTPECFTIVRCISNTNLNIRKLYALWIHKCSWNTYDKLPPKKFIPMYHMIMKMAKHIAMKEYFLSYRLRIRLLYDFTFDMYDVKAFKVHKKKYGYKKNQNALTYNIREFVLGKKWFHLVEEL